MKSISNAIAILLMLGLLLGIGWVGYISIRFIIGQFGVVDPQMSAILTISAVTVLLSALIIAAAIKSSAKGTVNSNHPRKLELYDQLVNALQNNDEKKYLYLEELKSHLIIWASDSVLNEYDTYLEVVSNKALDSDHVRKQAQNLIKTIRQDVSNDHSSLDSAVISKLLSKRSSVN